jgi:hypothetical protein
VWEDSDDEEISCEKEHQSQGVSAVAQEILQSGDAVVEVGGGATPTGGEWKKKMYERKRQLANEDKLPRIREGGNRTPWTLAQAVVLCAMCFFMGKNGAVPYPAEHPKQIAWWEEQERKQIQNCMRTIRMITEGCLSGTKKYSPRINSMQTRGKTEEKAKKRKRESDEALSTKMMGQDPKHSVEGVAIHLLFVFFRAVIPDFDRVWELMPAFDGLEADFIMRRKDWDPDVWTPIQMKSASECVQGKTVNYKLAHGDYPNVFCVCVGILGFKYRTDDVSGPNDTANSTGCSIGEIWNVGSCSAIETSMHPTFGVPYSKFAADRRLHFPGATDEAKRTFAEALLRDIEKWPTRLARNQVFYEFSDTINKKTTEQYRIEKNGFEVVDAALRTCGMRIDPVWRQNECVDYVVVSVESGEPLVFASGKTGTVKHGELKTRCFKLRGAPNKGFCDVVVACYSGAYHRVAVMSRDTAYVDGMKYFCWNENCLKPGVRIFDDIRNEQVGKEFAHYILSFRRV